MEQVKHGANQVKLDIHQLKDENTSNQARKTPSPAGKQSWNI